MQRLVYAEDAAADLEPFRQMAAGELDRHVFDERRYRRKDGSFMWARVNLSVHRDSKGQPQHFIAVVEDITERRTLDAQVRQANKMTRSAAGLRRRPRIQTLLRHRGFAEI